MGDAAMPRADSPALYGKPQSAAGGPGGGLPRPASSASSLAFSSEDGQSHGSGNSSAFGAHGSAPMPSGSLGAAGSNPRSLITWDSFNSTDFNALKSAVGLTNVSAAFAWQSSPAISQQHALLGGDFSAASAHSSAGTPGPATTMNGCLGSHASADTHAGAFAGSPYSGALAGLAATAPGGPNTPSPPLLGDALPPLAAPSGLASAWQQRQQQSSQPGTPPGGLGGFSDHGNGQQSGLGSGHNGGPMGGGRQLHRYMSEPPRPEELAAAAAGLLDGPNGSTHGTGGGCAPSPEPRSPLGPAALQRHSVGSMPFAAMSLPEGHAMNFPQLSPTSGGPTLQHQGSLSGGFSFRSSPQLFGSLHQQQQSHQPQSPGALGLAGLPPGSPGPGGLQHQQHAQPQQLRGQQQWQQQVAQQAHQMQQDAQLQAQQGHSHHGAVAGRMLPPRWTLPPRRTVSFDGGAGASHVAGTRSGTRPGFVHGRVGQQLDGQQQQHQQMQQQAQQRQPGMGNGAFAGLQQNAMGGPEFGRSSSFDDFAPPAPYQPAGLRRHMSMNSSLGSGLAALPQQPPPSPTLGGFGGGGLGFGAGALGSPRTNGSMHGNTGSLHGNGGGGGYTSPGPSPGGLLGAQFGRSGGQLGGGSGHGGGSGICVGEDLSATHRRVRSAEFGTPPRRGGRGPQGNSTGRNSGGRPGYGGRVTSAREMALNSDGSFSYGRGSVGSGHASPQILSRSTSGAALAARSVGSPTVNDGVGYRQLWAQVTSMQGSDIPAAGEETTVEDLLRVVKQLPSEAEAAPVVARGLHHLDSRALAALLKELAKAGVPARASEIFDWLRGLPAGHPLASLCDVYTYTTIIAQCGAGQGLGAALGLAAEMRSRGIALNCHAFSALMNVCIKAGELDLALDVFQQLLREGCTPNLVTYNILIDIYSKTGQWEEAVKVLDTLQAQGTAPEVRTYNTVIGACSRAGQPPAAAGVYHRMLADGAAPTATTATALVSVFARAGQVDEALAVLQDMAGRGAERSPVAYGALVAAAEKGGRPVLALQLFDDMLRALLKPSAATFSAALAACAQSGRWERALEIFELLRSRGCKPDAAVFGSLLAALAAGSQWQRALHVFGRLQASGIRPDAGHYNAMLQALWCGGGLPPQALALSHLDSALASGTLSVPDCGDGAETVLAGATPGAAAAAALHWLLLGAAFRGEAAPQGAQRAGSSDIGDGRVRGGEAAGAGLAAAAAGSIGSLIRMPSDAALPAPGRPSLDSGRDRDGTATTRVLLLLRDTAGTAASGPLPAEEVAAQLRALLGGLQAPVEVAATTQGVRLEAEASAVREWLGSPAAAPALALVAAARNAGGQHEALAEAEADRDARCRRALHAVQEFEARDCISAEPFGSEAAAAARRSRLAALSAAAAAAQLPPEVAADAAQLADRALCLEVANEGEGLAAAALLVAAPQAGRQLAPEQLAAALPGTEAASMAAAAQQLAAGLRRCEAGCGAVSSLRVLALLQERLGANSQDAAAAAWVAGPASALLKAAAGDARLLRFRASDVAAAALALGRDAAGAAPAWPLPLASLTGHADADSGALAAIAAVLREAQRDALQQHQQLQQQHLAHQQQQHGSATGLAAQEKPATPPLPHTPCAIGSGSSAANGNAGPAEASAGTSALQSHGSSIALASGSGNSCSSGAHLSANAEAATAAGGDSDSKDEGLTAEGVARLQRRLADFGVAD